VRGMAKALLPVEAAKAGQKRKLFSRA
jgi:hypothetical protein